MTALQGDLHQANIPYLSLAFLVNSLGRVNCKIGAGGRPVPPELRREAEAMILPNLPAFLDGKYRPQDNDERLALLGGCQFTNRSLVRLYAEAFAAAP
jgi:hypothetical protein